MGLVMEYVNRITEHIKIIKKVTASTISVVPKGGRKKAIITNPSIGWEREAERE
jgi:LDH2 family malate/lactate/ureidoglycolate dehydrogenase